MSGLIIDEKTASITFLSKMPHSRPLSLRDSLSRHLLVSPDTHKILEKKDEEQVLSDGEIEYPINMGSPILYPSSIISAMAEGKYKVPLHYPINALVQYQLLNQIKGYGEINANPTNKATEKHIYRMHQFCRSISGLILDVGCDKPSISCSVYPVQCEYLGIDPSINNNEFRIVGFGELLPFPDQSFSNVIFNTSLDHILDYHTAIDEAKRVLRQNGIAIVATYAWNERATLLKDNVHFHHFREFEIIGTLNRHFKIIEIKKYKCPKGDTHRYGLYVKAQKAEDKIQQCAL